jgi:hypothetical protein
MKYSRLTACTTLALAAAAGAQPGPKMAPGLWEHSMTMKSASGDMEAKMAEAQKQMANMPPEQRKMVEQMMAQRGVSMGGAGGKALTVQACVTPEQAARNELPQDRNCTQQSTERSGNTVKFKFTCSGEHKSSGEGEFTLQGDKGYTGRTAVDTVVQGKPEHMDMQLSGKWLGADCGSVKPRGG